jgi:hypothetical protein
MNIRKKAFSILIVLVLALAIPMAVQARVRSRIEVDEIPDVEYTVYLYDGYGRDMLAVLDIPDDGFRVHMYHTAFTRVETGSPDPYIKRFQWRIKGFKTAYQIMDKSGQVRGYLMASRFLWYQFLSFEDRIGVRVLDYGGGRR